MLTLVYFGGMTTPRAVFRTLTSQEEQPQLAIFVSTVVIAALWRIRCNHRTLPYDCTLLVP